MKYIYKEERIRTANLKGRKPIRADGDNHSIIIKSHWLNVYEDNGYHVGLPYGSSMGIYDSKEEAENRMNSWLQNNDEGWKEGKSKDQIKHLRKSLKLNTSDFGKLVGVSGRTVEAWEQGLRQPSKSALIILSRL